MCRYYGISYRDTCHILTSQEENLALTLTAVIFHFKGSRRHFLFVSLFGLEAPIKKGIFCSPQYPCLALYSLQQSHGNKAASVFILASSLPKSSVS